MSALRTNGLTKRFGDITAVQELNITVEDGEVFGFLGPNGAGKSTTINMILGFLDPTEGSATVLGHDVAHESYRIRQRIGLLPEAFDVYENLTGREHVVSAIETKGATDDPDVIIDRVGLDPEDARRAAGGYSKGMQQRLALGIALVGEPDLLILDEPSSGLDPKGIKLLRQIVREEVERGATVFFSSHILGQVEKVCDRVGIMSEGEMMAVDTIENLREEIGAGAKVEATVTEVPDLDEVRSIEGVSNVTAAADVVRITCTAPEAKIRALRRVDDLGTVRDLDVEDTSLEALFQKYTNGGTEEGEASSSDGGPAPEGQSADVGTAATGGEH
ncbi:MAG: ABC-2 type transport system ATP-binding protein [Halobacteriales archaeon]|jgi:ABC-2 type transport system ATP-binding protein